MQGKGEYADRSKYPLPSLIVLDLKMPEVDGFEFLAWHNNSRSAPIPVIILEGSGNELDHRRALAMGALTTFVKPVQLKNLYVIVRQMMQLLPGIVIDPWEKHANGVEPTSA